MIDLALQKPRSLGYPFEVWTLGRLQTAFTEKTGIHLSDSTIWEWLKEEGLRWKCQQSWFRAIFHGCVLLLCCSKYLIPQRGRIKNY